MKKGSKHTEESKKKIAKISKGRKHSDKTIKKISETLKKKYKETDFVNPFEGKKHSEETIKQMSEAKKGKKLTEKHKKKTSGTLKKKYSSGEYVPYNKGKHHTEESREKMSNGHKGKKHSKETRKKMSKSGKANPSFGFKGLKHSEETIKQMSTSRKKSFLDGTIKVPKNTNKNYKSGYIDELGHYSRSSWEKEVCLLLKKNKIDYEYEFKTFKLVKEDGNWCTYLPDIFIKKYNLFIEIKGWLGVNNDGLEKYYLFQKQYPEYNTYLIDKKNYNDIIKSEKIEINKILEIF